MKRELSQKKFVETAAQILEKEGMEALTTRRIGKEMHCNSASTYYYFRDLDELIAYAAMNFFTEYLTDVSKACSGTANALATYRSAWECLINHSILMPQLYMKLLYGKYSDDLGKISAAYYRLFPQQSLLLSPSIAEKIMDESFSGRFSHLVLGQCVEEGWLTRGDADILAELVKWLYLGLLKELVLEKISSEELKEKFFLCLDRMMEAFHKKQ